MAEYTIDKVVHYGSFKKNLDTVVDIMRSEWAGSLVIWGIPGSGKKTLIEEAQRITKVRCVYVSSHFYNEDYTAMKAIARDLGFKARGAHIADLMREIKSSSSHDKEKLVIVLLDFEELCRQRQSLLYNLLNLLHTDPNCGAVDTGVNLNIIGLTVCLDWAENIEKRVRSRINAKTIELTLPYRNQDELIEFASELLGGHELEEDFAKELKYLYLVLPCMSIRTLRKYLSSMCESESSNRGGKQRDKLIVKYDPNDWKHNYQTNSNNMLRERLKSLTKSQLDLLKFALNYCFVMERHSFSMQELGAYAHKRDYKTFLPNAQLTLLDLSLLLRLKLVKPAKHDQPLSQESQFYPAATFKQFKAVLELEFDLHNCQTDAFWRTLK